MFKWRATSFSKEGDDNEIAKINWQKIFSRTTATISTKLHTKHPLVKGIQVFQVKGYNLFQEEMITKRRKYIDKLNSKTFSRTDESISTKLGTRHPWAMVTQVCLNEGPPSFPSGDDNEMHLWVMGIQFLQIKIIQFSRRRYIYIYMYI